ncbi:MAG: pyruvate, phosphate dikinase [Bacteroidales bacterium]|nr:pyruvate, phosphate dikinase [Bacteroidales bacterium]
MEQTPRSEEDIQRLIAERKERLKELTCINHTNQIIKENRPVEDTLKQIAGIIPVAWQYPEMTVARIRLEDKYFTSPGFRESNWVQSSRFNTIDNRNGEIEVFYLKQFKDEDEGPFLREERQLIDNLSSILENYLNSIHARKLLYKSEEEDYIRKEKEISQMKKPGEINSRMLLQKFLNKQNANRDIFHDLMPYKVKEILLVATLYDAFSIEKEGRFSEHILGEYHQLNLTSMPRVTGVSNYDEAMEQLNTHHFDLVILMIGTDRVTPMIIAGKVKDEYPYIPIYVLLNNDKEISRFKEANPAQSKIDKLFVWNGDSSIFFAMVKHLEDRVNVENDTQIGMVKVILLTEDSEKYYSRYLPLLYNIVMEQTKRIIDDVSTDDLFKVLRLRARPKILLASTYEEALELIVKHMDNLLCLISDVKFIKDGHMDENAGFSLVQHAKNVVNGLPTVIQSSDIANSRKAYELKSTFINKNSDTLLQDIRNFISHHLGFGNFVYKDASGKKIAEAKSLREFEQQIETIPVESLVYHGKRNHFSLWLMARGELKIAKMIHPVRVTDFKTPDEFRDYLKHVIKKYRNESNIGKIINFEESAILDETNIVSLGTGPLGGKGRGCAFINSLIYNLNFPEIIPEINIRTPKTCIIGTDEFDIFIERNSLQDVIRQELPYDELRKIFIESDLSYNLEKKLKGLLKQLNRPLAIRSSSLLEDSTMQPFSGIFDTYLIPNNDPSFNKRLKQLSDCIKMVYASIYSPHSKGYFEAINFKLEEEKMGVVLQEVVGTVHRDYFYPHVSGTAQSHNYYPIAHMEPEDGYALAALGLGHYVVNGERSYRFSPVYPSLEVNSPMKLYKDSQVNFIALDMKSTDVDFVKNGSEANLIKLDISTAEQDGVLKHLASVYDVDNDRIEPGISSAGPRILNFANILKYEYVPLTKTLKLILDVGKEALGSPIEIEYALDLDKAPNQKPSFHLLQIKPMLGTGNEFSFELDELEKDKILMLAEQSMGNGKIDNIHDVIYVKPTAFDKIKTRDIASELEAINKRMMKRGRSYILLGPGRWGTADPFIGIPVKWSQISNARVIVETSLEDFPLDASLGSHFFHNVTSMNVGYFSIQHDSPGSVISWKMLEKQKVEEETSFIRHVKFKKSLCVMMDGKKGISVILNDGHCNRNDLNH